MVKFLTFKLDNLPLNNWLREEEVSHFEPKILEVYY